MAACERECVAAHALRAAATHRVRARVLHKAVVRQRPQKRRVPRVLKVHRACVGGAGGAAGARSGGRARGDLSDPRAQAPRRKRVPFSPASPALTGVRLKRRRVRHDKAVARAVPMDPLLHLRVLDEVPQRRQKGVGHLKKWQDGRGERGGASRRRGHEITRVALHEARTSQQRTWHSIHNRDCAD